MTLLSPNHNHAADECIAQIPQHHIPTQEEKVRASESFDKAVLTAAHMAALHDAYILEMATHPAQEVTIKPASPTSTLAGLKSSCLRQLKIGKVHRKRVLVGTLCSKTLCSHTPNGLFVVNVLEDEEGLATPIYLSNALEENCGSHHAQRLYPQGSKVAVKEPYLTRLPDGEVYLSVEKPSDFAFLWVPEHEVENGGKGAAGEQDNDEVVDFGARKEVDDIAASAGKGEADDGNAVDNGGDGATEEELEANQEFDESSGNGKGVDQCKQTGGVAVTDAGEDKEQLGGDEDANGGEPENLNRTPSSNGGDFDDKQEQLDANGADTAESKELDSGAENGDGRDAGKEQEGVAPAAVEEEVAVAPVSGNRELSFDYLTEMQDNGKAEAEKKQNVGEAEAATEGKGEEEAEGNGKAAEEEMSIEGSIEGSGTDAAAGEEAHESNGGEAAEAGIEAAGNDGGGAASEKNRELSMEELVGMRKEAPAKEAEEEEASSSLRSKGNALFARGQFAGAAEMYTRGARKAKSGGERLEEVMCISNRAEAWLRLGRNQDALQEADAALALLKGGPTAGAELAEAKALFRKGRALMGLRRFEEALDVLRQVLAMAPADRQLREAAAKCRDRLLHIVKPGKRQRAAALKKKNSLPTPIPAAT